MDYNGSHRGYIEPDSPATCSNPHSPFIYFSHFRVLSCTWEVQGMFTGSTNVHRRDEYTVQEIDRYLAETRQVVSFFDPKDERVTTPPGAVPARSWKMSDQTRKWVLAGHDAMNQATLLRQVEEAEEKRQTHYYLTYQDRGGGFYEIEYGLMKGSGIEKPV